MLSLPLSLPLTVVELIENFLVKLIVETGLLDLLSFFAILWFRTLSLLSSSTTSSLSLLLNRILKYWIHVSYRLLFGTPIFLRNFGKILIDLWKLNCCFLFTFLRYSKGKMFVYQKFYKGLHFWLLGLGHCFEGVRTVCKSRIWEFWRWNWEILRFLGILKILRKTAKFELPRFWRFFVLGKKFWMSLSLGVKCRFFQVLTQLWGIWCQGCLRNRR